jgi:hypothetical protein
MKHTAWIILATILLSACEKKYCWECAVNTDTLGTSAAGDSMRVIEGSWEEQCDKTEREIETLQQQKTGVTVTQDGDYTIRKAVAYQCHQAD